MIRRILFSLCVFLALLLGACVPLTGAPAQPQPTATVDSDEVQGIDDLIGVVQAAGLQVEPAGSVQQSFFSVEGQIIQVDGADVQVFEYANEEARQSDSTLISADGTTVGNTMITWVDQPHFWAQGRLIVLYVGQDASVIAALTDALGQPVAG